MMPRRLYDGYVTVTCRLQDTGRVFAVKKIDKRLIKHKNRYRSCNTEVACLKAVESPFICCLHYTYQTKDDVCLVLDLLHGGTLSYLLSQRKKVGAARVQRGCNVGTTWVQRGCNVGATWV